MLTHLLKRMLYHGCFFQLINQLNFALFSIYSLIFTLVFSRVSLGDINYTTKSGHKGKNLSCYSTVKTYHFYRLSQEGSGARCEPFGKIKTVLDSNTFPRLF